MTPEQEARLGEIWVELERLPVAGLQDSCLKACLQEILAILVGRLDYRSPYLMLRGGAIAQTFAGGARAAFVSPPAPAGALHVAGPTPPTLWPPGLAQLSAAAMAAGSVGSSIAQVAPPVAAPAVSTPPAGAAFIPVQIPGAAAAGNGPTAQVTSINGQAVVMVGPQAHEVPPVPTFSPGPPPPGGWPPGSAEDIYTRLGANYPRPVNGAGPVQVAAPGPAPAIPAISDAQMNVATAQYLEGLPPAEPGPGALQDPADILRP